MERRLVLEAKGLRKAFKDLVAVKDVSFHIAEGETYGLLGPNGAGKTTTINMAIGLLERDAGEETLELLVDEADRALAAILAAAAGAGISVHSVDVDEPNLEAVFLHLTGKALRD